MRSRVDGLLRFVLLRCSAMRNRLLCFAAIVTSRVIQLVTSFG